MVLFTESKPQDIVETEMQSLSLNSWSRASKPLFSRVLRLFPFRIAF